MCIYVYIHVCEYTWKPEELDASEAGVGGSCELPDMDAWDQI